MCAAEAGTNRMTSALASRVPERSKQYGKNVDYIAVAGPERERSHSRSPPMMWFAQSKSRQSTRQLLGFLSDDDTSLLVCSPDQDLDHAQGRARAEMMSRIGTNITYLFSLSRDQFINELQQARIPLLNSYTWLSWTMNS